MCKIWYGFYGLDYVFKGDISDWGILFEINAFNEKIVKIIMF